ncbi:vacuolar protein sorting/targeting protein PEP1 [Myotisia sp. PD_48]|nr:vacuolar protein sorting/targeting protein PEP1 [Myotisia sp. PD_48]
MVLLLPTLARLDSTEAIGKLLVFPFDPFTELRALIRNHLSTCIDAVVATPPLNMILRKLLLASGLLLASILPSTFAKDADAPEIKVKKLKNIPFNFYYFEDTDTIVFQESEVRNIHISTDAGATWNVLEGPDEAMKHQVWSFWPHPFDKKKAYVLGRHHKHWITEDAAKTWRQFEIKEADMKVNLVGRSSLVFHGRDSNKVIVQSHECPGSKCHEVSFYTTDGFKEVKPLVKNHRGCSWAVGSPLFGDGDGGYPKEVEDRVYCVIAGPHSISVNENRLVYSDSFFKDDKAIETPLNNGRAVSGVIRTASVKKFLLAAAKSDRTNEMALYVTHDALNWHRGEFHGGPKLEEDAYTVLESTNYSIQIDVVSSHRKMVPMGTLFTSDSNGTHFTQNIDHVNRDIDGFVDFEKVSGIQGIFLLNQIDNAAEIEKGSTIDKKLVSRISFDDGRTFQPLKAGEKDLHLHSVTELKNAGRVFSSPAPGLIMGVGNTGSELKKYNDGDLYVSNDAGITWKKALDDARKYEFGDQGSVLVAIYDEGRTDKISYSFNHGKDWKTAELPNKIRARLLTTTPDSTSLQFLLVGDTKEEEFFVMSIDFSGSKKRKCGKGDFDRWPARLNEKSEPDCLMGHKQFYQRRKADADCFVKEKFIDPVPETERCKCTEEDFECEFGFNREKDKCVPTAKITAPEGQCKKPEDKFLGPSGYRRIPGNDCIREGGVDLTKTIERPCSDITKAPVTGDIQVKTTYFKADGFSQYYYLERSASSSGDDETIIMQTKDQAIHLTKDHGKTWNKVETKEDIIGIIPHRYKNDVAYLITAKNKAYWTVDRGNTFRSFETKSPPKKSRGPDLLNFHPEHTDWLIWIGAGACTRGGHCSSDAHYSTNRGEDWQLLMRSVRKCKFIGKGTPATSDKLVFCAQYEDENESNKKVQLLSSEDWFAGREVHFKDIVDFAPMSEFIVVAARAEKNAMRPYTSIDGKTFANAEFPSNFHVESQQAYTVLDSSTHSIFLHVTVNPASGREFGSIVKSNSNGTSYVLSIAGVNRNSDGYVDFEKMNGIEGVSLTNVVSDPKKTMDGAPKKLRTMITHNDGAEWGLLPPPPRGPKDREYSCKPAEKGTPSCALHLHGYTERRDVRDTYSSGSAIGLMMGIGNVGEFLGIASEADTFMTTDAGISWKMVKNGRYQWEYGDQGSIIVIVPEGKPSKVLSYTLDEGKTWVDFQFSEVDMDIQDISTVPSDTSLNFLLWGREVGSGAKSGFATVNIDFSGLKERSRQCKLNEQAPEADDYKFWTPKHPLQENNCLFGHVSKYHRKKPEAKCYNGPKIVRLDAYKENCKCTRRDYECDYNYEIQTDGSCQLVPGLEPLDPLQQCKDNPNAYEYFEPTGFRKLPLSTCEGGKQLDHFVSHPCPNKESEYEKHRPGLHGAGLFFAIVLPIAAAGAVGYWAFTRWDGKFGRIRLGEPGGSGPFSSSSLLVSIPVAIVAGTVAVFTALPLLISSLWRSFRGYSRVPGRTGPRPYASRAAFAARRGDFAGDLDDEDELLGADEFEDDEDTEV